MWRLANCSGSLALVNAVRAQAKILPLPTPEMAAGTRIHAAMAGDTTPLVEREESAYRRLETFKGKIVEEWMSHGDRTYSKLFENRFWFRKALRPIFSGQPDYVIIQKTRALVLNFKTGWGEQEPAADNLQLRAEIVLLKANRPELVRIDGAILSANRPDFDRVTYGLAELVPATTEILSIVERSTGDAPRNPGPWCKLCPAAIYCRECQEHIQSINPNLGFQDLPRGEAGVELWEKIQLAKNIHKQMEAAYEEILVAEPDALPNYILPERGRARRIVPLPQKLKDALADYLTPEQVDGFAEYHVAKIQDFFGLQHKLGGKELVNKFAAIVGDAVQTTYDKPFIRPLTKKERQQREILANAH
jgi:hypothetical protein